MKQKWPDRISAREIDVTQVYEAMSANLAAHEAHSGPYYRWVAQTLRPWLGRRVIELGAGDGLLSRCLFGFELYVVTERWEPYFRRLERIAADRPEIMPLQLDVTDVNAWMERLGALELDTVFSSNLLEHLDDDVSALTDMAAIVRPGGRVVNFVPALRELYGPGDRAIGHFRRYERSEIREKMTAAGLIVESVSYFNRLGYWAWFVLNKVLRRPLPTAGQFRFFNSFVPVFRVWDKLLPLSKGSNLLAVGRRPGTPDAKLPRLREKESVDPNRASHVGNGPPDTSYFVRGPAA